MDLISELEVRGLVHVSTDLAALRAQIAEGPITIYYGCDPTADSLHVGNLIGLTVLRRFQDQGHHAIALAGGATGMVGDPSGRSDERNLLDDETLSRNVAAIKEQIARVVDLDSGRLVDNRDWTGPLTLLEFLRDVGKYATVNQMVARDSVRSRLDSEQGISYTEFSYMLIQANDYLWLHDNLGCTLQVGGSDQWGNIVSGVDLIRRARGFTTHALAWPLLLAPDGSKLGKSTGARSWLDANRTSPYQLHQHFVNLSDAEAGQQLPMFSLRPLEEINEALAAHRQAPEQRAAQRLLADDVTAMLHGRDAVVAATAAADVLFGGDPVHASAETIATVAAEVGVTNVVREDLSDPAAVLVQAGLSTSKSEARRLIDQRGVRVNGQPIESGDALAAVEPLHGEYLVLRRGRQQHHVLRVTPQKSAPEVDAHGPRR